MTQLFKQTPDNIILLKILNTLGIDEFKEEFSFRKKDLFSLGTIDKMKLIEHDLRAFYYPCKAKLYLENIDENKCVTIIRQFLRSFGYNLISKEKYNNGEKYIIYSLSAAHHIKSPKIKIIKFNL
jgi:hypothetical protein